MYRVSWTPKTVSLTWVWSLFWEKKLSADRTLGAAIRSFCFSPKRKAVSEKVLKAVIVKVVDASVLLVAMIGFRPIEVHWEEEPERVSEARDHRPAASISERCRIMPFSNWYLRSGPPYFLVEAAVCVILTGVRKIWQ
jgi:hypothetical protein